MEEVRPVKSRYLVVYDYTTGGVWAFIDATSESEIVVRYPELKIIRTRPGWMMAEEENGLPIYDLEDPPTGLLRNLLDSRATSSR